MSRLLSNTNTSIMAQLFVLGPAFGHPSIDAECTAAIALLRLREVDFTITRSHTGELPLLIDGKHEIAGFSNICHHLNCQPSADDIALSALIDTRAPDPASSIPLHRRELQCYKDSLHSDPTISCTLYCSRQSSSYCQGKYSTAWHR